MHHVKFACFFTLLLGLFSCGTRDRDLEERMTIALMAQNDAMESILNQHCLRLSRQIEKGSNGTPYNKIILATVQRTQKQSRLANSALDRALNLETQNPTDSIISLLRSWKTSKSAFWTENLEDGDKSRWTDSTENEMILETPARFSENRKSLWRAEAEIIQSHFHSDFYAQIDFLASKIRIGDFLPDTLSFEDFLPENPVIAGSDAKVYLRMVKRVPELNPTFEGSGKFEASPYPGTTLMVIKTSESMIPEGQNEATVAYNAQAKVPTIDELQIQYRLTGKVRIRRPCKSD